MKYVYNITTIYYKLSISVMLSAVYMYNLSYSLNQNLVLSFVYMEKSMDTGAQQQYGVRICVYCISTIYNIIDMYGKNL